MEEREKLLAVARWCATFLRDKVGMLQNKQQGQLGEVPKGLDPLWVSRITSI